MEPVCFAFFRLDLLSEPIGNPALFQDSISRVPGFDFCVNRNMPPGDRAVPNIVISLAAPRKYTMIQGKDVTHPFFIFGHYKASLSRRSDKKVRVRGD